MMRTLKWLASGLAIAGGVYALGYAWWFLLKGLATAFNWTARV